MMKRATCLLTSRKRPPEIFLSTMFFFFLYFSVCDNEFSSLFGANGKDPEKEEEEESSDNSITAAATPRIRPHVQIFPPLSPSTWSTHNLLLREIRDKEVKKKNREKGPCWVYTIAEQREGWDVTMLTIMNKMLLFISTTKLLMYMY